MTIPTSVRILTFDNYISTLKSALKYSEMSRNADDIAIFEYPRQVKIMRVENKVENVF